MSANWLPGLVMATGIWIIIAVAVFAGAPRPNSDIWIASASEKVRSHPTLMRAADPTMTGSIGRQD
jgi:hypothetical protein